jgi:hypothetical protein
MNWSVFTNRRALLLAGAIGLVVVLALSLVLPVVLRDKSGPRIHPHGAVPVPSVVIQSPEPTDLGTVMAKLGPFVPLTAVFASNQPDTNYPALLLINSDGSEEASSAWTLPSGTGSWSQLSLPQIVAVSPSPGGYVLFKLDDANSPNTYIVRAGQPFVVAEVPQYVVRLTASGGQWTMGTVIAYHAKTPLGS